MTSPGAQIRSRNTCQRIAGSDSSSQSRTCMRVGRGPFYNQTRATFCPATCSRQPRRAASMAATSIFFIVIMAAKARCASPPPAASASVSVRGVICQERAPAVPCTTRTHFPCRHCRRLRSSSGPFLPDSPSQSGKKTPRCAGNAGPPFRPRQGMPKTVNSTVSFIALLAAGKVSGCVVNSREFTIRKGGGVKARRPPAHPCRTRGKWCSSGSTSVSPCCSLRAKGRGLLIDRISGPCLLNISPA